VSVSRITVLTLIIRCFSNIPTKVARRITYYDGGIDAIEYFKTQHYAVCDSNCYCQRLKLYDLQPVLQFDEEEVLDIFRQPDQNRHSKSPQPRVKTPPSSPSDPPLRHGILRY
jgi:hypothetical protein